MNHSARQETQQTNICQDGRKLMADDLLINIQQENVGIKTTEVNEDSKTVSSGQDLMENVRLNLSKEQSFKETDYKNGVNFMKDLKIVSDGKTKSKKLILLDACLVQFNSKLDKDKDKITGFDSLASKQHLIVAIYDFGISFTGVGRPQDYEMLLRSLSLETKDTSRKRSFNVGCSFRGKQTRNLSVMLDVIHEDHMVVKGHQNPHRLLSNKVIHPAMFDNLQLIAKPFPVSFKYNTAEDSGAGVALVMIVCIGFIVLLIVLGIVRIRSLQIGEDSNPKASVEDPEFNIILNPIHPDNISKKEDGTNECFHDRNKLNMDCEDSDEESFGISETQRDWKNSAVLL